MSKSTPLAYAGIVGATFFWGTNFNAGAYIIKSMAPISASIERFSISTLLLVLIFGLAGKLRLSTLKNNLVAFIRPGPAWIYCVQPRHILWPANHHPHQRRTDPGDHAAVDHDLCSTA